MKKALFLSIQILLSYLTVGSAYALPVTGEFERLNARQFLQLEIASEDGTITIRAEGEPLRIRKRIRTEDSLVMKAQKELHDLDCQVTREIDLANPGMHRVHGLCDDLELNLQLELKTTIEVRQGTDEEFRALPVISGKIEGEVLRVDGSEPEISEENDADERKILNLLRAMRPVFDFL